jgi:hypothetical protein
VRLVENSFSAPAAVNTQASSTRNTNPVKAT